MKTLEEVKSLLFNTLYLWTIAFVFPLVINYNNYLVLFAPNYVFFLVYFLCTLERLTLLLIFRLLNKKKFRKPDVVVIYEGIMDNI
jgi:hypothetical protein